MPANAHLLSRGAHPEVSYGMSLWLRPSDKNKTKDKTKDETKDKTKDETKDKTKVILATEAT